MDDKLKHQVDEFMRDGYYIIRGALDPGQTRRFIDAIIGISDNVQTREIPDIIDKHEIFHPLLVYPPVFNLIKALMGSKVQMESVNATRVKPGKGMAIGWHIDSHPYPEPLPPLWHFPITVNCAYYLDDITSEKGPLVVVPGTHLSGKNPPDGLDRLPGQLEVMANAGDAVVFHGALWHAALPNVHPTEERRALYYNYMQSFCKQRTDNFTGERSNQLRENGPFFKQQLLGKFDGWHEVPQDADEELKK